jgi:hypothetical protein
MNFHSHKIGRCQRKYAYDLVETLMNAPTGHSSLLMRHTMMQLKGEDLELWREFEAFFTTIYPVGSPS